MLNEDLKNTFGKLNKAGVNYVVLRNYLPVQNLNSKGDIDILVHPDDSERIKKILLADNWLLRIIPRVDGHTEMFKFGKEKKIYIFDIQDDLLFGKKKIKIGEVKAILNKRKLLDEYFFVPNDIHSLVLFIFRLALEKDSINDLQFARLEVLYNLSKDDKDFLEIIKKDFGEKVYELLLEILENKKNFLDRQNYKKLAIMAQENLISYQGSFLNCFWREIKNKIISYALLFRKVELIVFVGSDGSGKSTLVEKLKYFSPVFGAQIYFGWRGYYFKPMEKLEEKSVSKNKVIREINNRFKFILFNMLFPFDLFFRFLKIKKNAKYGIIIADRYPLPKKYFGKTKIIPVQKICSKLTLWLTYLLIPEPSLCFIAEADPKIIWARKEERSFNKLLDEIERSRQAEKLFKCPVKTIKTDCSIEESFNKIYEHLFEHFNSYAGKF
jgi:thymidylate kinase